MHYRLIRLVLKVAVPARTELLHIILLQLFFSGPDLHTSFNTISGQRPGPGLIPLIVDSLLEIGITSNKVIKALDVRLRAIGREGEVMVLEIKTNTWQLDLELYSSLL